MIFGPFRRVIIFGGGILTKKLIIKLLNIKNVILSNTDQNFSKFQNGLVYRKTSNYLCVCLENFTLVVKEIYDSSNNDIKNDVKLGERFVTPVEKLFDAKQRVKYDSDGLVNLDKK